jgi:hypothetical protein
VIEPPERPTTVVGMTRNRGQAGLSLRSVHSPRPREAHPQQTGQGGLLGPGSAAQTAGR